ncbi:MAG: penicillin-binding protein 1C [Magnetococcus sp. DMHC-1]
MLLGWLVPLPTQAGEIPGFVHVQARYATSDALLLDRQGEILHQLRVDATRRQLAWTPLHDISLAAIDTILAAEDRHFWEHGGVAWGSVSGALWDRLVKGKRRGASTITMQLASLLDPKLKPSGHQRRTWSQKLAQMRAAWAIEQTWSKHQILEAYLNLASFRGELQGIQAASRSLFDKLPFGLEHPEALLLAALLQAPNAPALTTASRACVLARIHQPEVTCPQLRELALQRLVGGIPPIRTEAAWAPHVTQQLLGTLPATPSTRKIVSTLDGPLQRLASDTLTRHLQQLQTRHVLNSAVLVVDNATGQILAYVSHGDNDPATRHVDGVQAPRQAGSTLKPFLYHLALEQHLLTPASLLDDAPVELYTPRGNYVPQNYDRDFKGWVSLRTALAASLNVPAVRTLLLTGLDPFVERLRRLGFGQITEEGAYYGYALALGSVDVSLWQLVGAYRTLALGGHATPLRLRLADPSPAAIEVLSEPAAFLVADMLADPLARSLTFGLDNPLQTPFWSAVKTGTSKQMRDNWCIGFTRQHTVGVWVGNFNGEPMHDVSGITGAAPIWQEIMTYLQTTPGTSPSLPPPPPTGVTQVQTTFHPPLEPTRLEWFLTGTEIPHVQLHDRTTRSSRILHPGDGTIMAMDPDIPPDRQRLFVRMEPENPQLRWHLDGQLLDPHQTSWPLTQGSHTLELIDDQARMVDRVRFQVRGSVLKNK